MAASDYKVALGRIVHYQAQPATDVEADEAVYAAIVTRIIDKDRVSLMVFDPYSSDTFAVPSCGRGEKGCIGQWFPPPLPPGK
jgi:hypothetical protein